MNYFKGPDLRQMHDHLPEQRIRQVQADLNSAVEKLSLETNTKIIEKIVVEDPHQKLSTLKVIGAGQIFATINLLKTDEYARKRNFIQPVIEIIRHNATERNGIIVSYSGREGELTDTIFSELKKCYFYLLENQKANSIKRKK